MDSEADSLFNLIDDDEVLHVAFFDRRHGVITYKDGSEGCIVCKNDRWTFAERPLGVVALGSVLTGREG